MTLRRLGPKTLAMRTAKRMDGSASWTSTMRISTCPVKPPIQPDTMPMRLPMMAAPGTTIATTISETRAPCNRRL